MKNISILLSAIFLLAIGNSGYAQKGDAPRLNNYKYIIVPLRFDFQHKDNEYLLSSRIKHFLNQRKFNTLIEAEDFPKDLAFNRCLGLWLDVKSASEGVFSMNTRLKIILKNCRNQVVFETREGESKLKSEKDAYKAAIDEALASFDRVQYAYNGNQGFEDEQARHESVKKAETIKGTLGFTLGKTYRQKGENFKMEKIDAGYLLRNSTTGDRVAFLNLADNNSILYNSRKINGTATIKNNGDIVVEYF